MARTIEFDRDEALERAMTTFWRLGYGSTSVGELEAATGLRRGSLYNTFGDKEALFAAGLDRYWETIGRARIRHLADPEPKEGLRRFLATIVEEMGDYRRPRGCLVTNTSLECPSAPDSVLRLVTERTRAMEDALYHLFQRAQALGELQQGVDLRALARFYLAVVKGIGVLHKINGDASALADVVDVAMQTWPQPTRPGNASARSRSLDVP